MKLLTGLILQIALAEVLAFVPSQVSIKPNKVTTTRRPFQTSEKQQSQGLFKLPNLQEKKKSGLDGAVRKKLLTESIAPWRTLRLFLYGSAGSGAALGGFITLSGVAAALSGARTDVDFNVEYTNLAIDFGAVAAFVVAFKWDFDNGNKMSEGVEEKLEKKKGQKKIAATMRSREKELENLSLDIQVSSDGKRTQAKVSAIQDGAKQHVIIVAGPRKATKEALLGANLLKLDFSMSNILVVPYTIGDVEVRPTKGFGDGPTWESNGYVAKPSGEGWDAYIEAEMADAVVQNGPSVEEQGIAIVLANNGKVIRRGVGKVPWRQMVEDLENEISPEKKEELPDIFL